MLAFTLEKLFREYGAGGKLTLDKYAAMGGVGGSKDRALVEALRAAGSDGFLANLRRLIVPFLATWNPVSGAASRLVGREADLLSGNRASLAPLADALVESRLLTRSRDSIEIAHEALLRRAPIAGWLDEQKEALKLRDDVLREAEDWKVAGKAIRDLLRRGERLQAALDLLDDPDFAIALRPAREYLAACRKLESSTKWRARRGQVVLMGLMASMIIGLLGWINQDFIKEQINWYWTMRPYMLANFRPFALSAQATRSLKPGDPFRECAKDCPEMIVIGIGAFEMGSPETEKGRESNEGPMRRVLLNHPFAVSTYDITFDEWDVCAATGGCAQVLDNGFGRGRKPAISMTWDEAKQYVSWLSLMTGQQYRLLSEAEYEYAARAHTTTPYSWGDDIGKSMANCNGCGSQWDNRETSPVGSFAPNGFGLYDMHGNVWKWLEDCYDDNLSSIPLDGSPRTLTDCNRHAQRGGAWYNQPVDLRSAYRTGNVAAFRDTGLGLRVARTLIP